MSPLSNKSVSLLVAGMQELLDVLDPKTFEVVVKSLLSNVYKTLQHDLKKKENLFLSTDCVAYHLALQICPKSLLWIL